jgi:type I restriction enzyme S subunit
LLPYLANVNVRWGEIELDNLRTMRFEPHERDRYGLKFGDIVMCEGGEPGRCAIWKEQIPGMMIQKALHRIRPRDGLDYQFLFYSLVHIGVTKKFDQYFTGATIKHLPGEKLAKVEIDIPPLPIQRRIAGILSAYDELIENSQRRIKILESMARTLYREWFVHLRFPGHESVPLVPSPLGEIPQGWEVATIDEVCSRVTDGSHRSPRSVNEGMPMASSKDMHDWGLNLDTARLISQEDFAELARNDCKPQMNDVLITKDGANYLKHIFVTRAEQEVVLLSSVAMLRPSTRINPHFLVATLKEPENKGKLKNFVTGAAIPRVILKDFKRFELLLPSNEVQTAWAKIAEAMTEQIWRLIDKIQNLRRTRNLLLPRLLCGQLDVEALPGLSDGSQGSCRD